MPWSRASRHSPPEPQRTLGFAVRAWRDERDLTQADLAAAAGISVAYLGSIEKGSANPSLGVLLKIARELDHPLSRLLEGDRPKPRSRSKPRRKS